MDRTPAKTDPLRVQLRTCNGSPTRTQRRRRGGGEGSCTESGEASMDLIDGAFLM